MPESHADVLPNGYDVSCVNNNNGVAICTITGCPRVHEDLAGDVVHTVITTPSRGPNGQSELSKGCGGATSQEIAWAKPYENFNLAVQGCRKSTLGGDDCGPWSDYKYTAPPNPAAQQAPPQQQPQTPPQAQTKQCPDGSTIPVADACPVKKVAPTNAVTMKVAKAGLQVNVTVGNTSDLAAECTYDATEANGLGLPVHRDFSLAAKGSTTLTFPAPIIGQSWQLVSACNAPFEGQTVEIGRATGNA